MLGNRRKWLASCVGLMMSVLAAQASAQSVTPPMVYQATEDLNTLLGVYHTANNSTAAADPDAPALTERLPRHSVQKAREVMIKVQALRGLKGLPETAVPPMPARDIGPADVKAMVDTALASTRELRPAFGNPALPAPVALVDSKTPSDVYGALVRASLALDGLGIPAPAPNDVYRVALSVVADLEKVRAARGSTAPVAEVEKASGKKPIDAYDHAYALLADLKDLVESHPDFTISKGVILPNKRTANVKPGHVLDLVNGALSEIAAIKAKVGATAPSEIGAIQSGKTPSDVFTVISQARALVASLKASKG